MTGGPCWRCQNVTIVTPMLLRVLINLFWPHGYSVNDGVNKTSYLNTDFVLTFSTVDHITTDLKKVGRGAYLYKIDVSRAFHHIKLDPHDYDLLGLKWDGSFYDVTYLSFGIRHGTQIFSIQLTLYVTYCNVIS